MARAQRLRRELDEPLPPLEKEPIGLDVLRRLPPHARLLVARQLGLERGRDVQRDVGLDREDVRQLPVVRLGPELPIGLDVDQRRHDAHAVAGVSDAAVEQRRRRRASRRSPERCCRCLNGITDVREITLSARIFDRCAMTSSVMPSAKYSFSGFALRLRNGSTATDDGSAGDGYR